MALTKVTSGMVNPDPSDAANLSSGSVPAARLGNVDTSGIVANQDDIALLGFKVAANGSLAKYNLVDQAIDAFEDASGVDASASTDEVRNDSNYYSGTSGPDVTGGTITTDGAYTIHTFGLAQSGTSYVTDTAQTIEYLVVAGGGGGGYNAGSGGGAGGVRTATGFSVSATSYTVTVGDGGAGSSNTSRGGKGSTSTFSTISSTGGGGGGSRGASETTGGTGGSGGGGASDGHAGGSGNEGGYSPVEGYAGGTTTYGPGSSAGGGGASETAQGTHSVTGGDGVASSISGASVTYGGGGGNANGDGGAGGGGNAGADGTDGLGGGGGGAGGTGGSGGSGIVIIRRPSALTYNDMTLVSNATTAVDGAPTTGDLVITYTDAAGTATVNTDIKAYISRNGSAYTSAVTLVSQGTTGGHTILTANGVDLSGITTGTSMRWKIETLNQSAAKETRIQAVSLGWS